MGIPDSHFRTIDEPHPIPYSANTLPRLRPSRLQRRSIIGSPTSPWSAAIQQGERHTVGERATVKKSAPDMFTPRQRKIIAFGLTLACFVIIVAIVITMGRLTIAFFQFFAGVFLPLAVAWILAVMLSPYHALLTRRTHSRLLALLLVLLSLLLPLVAVMWFFGALILDQLTGLASAIPVWGERVLHWVQARTPWLADMWERYGLALRLESFLSSHGETLTSGAAEIGVQLAQAGQAIFRSMAGLLSWAVLPVYFIFFLMAPSLSVERMSDMLPFLKPDTRRIAVDLATRFVEIIVTFFRGQFIIALLQGILYGTGFAIVGLDYGVLLGLIFGVLNIIPYLGNVMGLLCVLPLAFFQVGGGWTMVMGTGIVFIVTQCTEAYILTPRIMGNRTGLHPGVIIFAMFFWGTALGGILGMILAIPLTAFLVVVWRLVRTRYIREWL